MLDAKNDLIHWMEPGDIAAEPFNWMEDDDPGFGDLKPNYPAGFLVAFVDGAVWWIKADVPSKVILPFFTLEGARSHDRDTELASYALEKLPPLEKEDGKFFLPDAEQTK